MWVWSSSTAHLRPITDTSIPHPARPMRDMAWLIRDSDRLLWDRLLWDSTHLRRGRKLETLTLLSSMSGRNCCSSVFDQLVSMAGLWNLFFFFLFPLPVPLPSPYPPYPPPPPHPPLSLHSSLCFVIVVCVHIVFELVFRIKLPMI